MMLSNSIIYCNINFILQLSIKYIQIITKCPIHLLCFLLLKLEFEKNFIYFYFLIFSYMSAALISFPPFHITPSITPLPSTIHEFFFSSLLLLTYRCVYICVFKYNLQNLFRIVWMFMHLEWTNWNWIIWSGDN